MTDSGQASPPETLDQNGQVIGRDRYRNTSLYRWLRGQSWAKDLRDFYRMLRLLPPLEAVRLSRELAVKPSQVVEVDFPSVRTPVFLRSNSSDIRVFYEIFGEKIYDFELPAAASYIVDAGANIGLASVFFAQRYADCTIIAVEPSSANISILKKNAAAYPGISFREAGLWHCDEPLRFLDARWDYWAFRVLPCRPEEANFPTVTIPGIMKEYGLPRIDILKMDIEGSERELLMQGDPAWLDSVSLLIIELHGDLARERFGEVGAILGRHGLFLLRGGENCFFARKRDSSSHA